MAISSENESKGFDPDFAEELEQLQYYSHGDYVEVEIVDVERSDDRTAVITFSPPLGSPFMKEMDVPVDPSTETEFIELLDEVGRNFDTAREIVGDRVPAKFTEDGWEIQYTEPEVTIRDRLMRAYDDGLSKKNLKDGALAAVVSGAVLYWPITGIAISLGMWLVDSDDDDTEEMPFIGAVLTYAIGFAIWIAGYSIVSWLAHLAGFQFPIEVTLLV